MTAPRDRSDPRFGDIVSQIMDYENGDMGDEQTIAFFQKLVDTGLAWELQGSYGRTAARMIAAGVISAKGESK